MLHFYSVLLSHLQIAKYKGFLIKIQVFTGFSAKLKVLKDFNKLKVFKGFKGSPRGPVKCKTICHNYICMKSFILVVDF